MKRPLPAHLLAMTSLAIACGATDDDDAAPEFRVEAGQLDTDSFPGVGKVTWPVPGGNGVCSGTLVGPRHVLTAAHCFDGISPNVTVTFDLAADTTTDDASLRFVHTAGVSGPVQRPGFFAGKTFDPTNSDHTSRDVAIVVLDTVVPVAIARPHRVAGIHDTPWCTFEGEGWGTMVGYGPTEEYYPELGAPLVQVDKGKRNFMWAPDWEDSTSGDGRAARWINDFWGGGVQEGSNMPGDSGGPLFEGIVSSPFEPPAVCGVVSSYTWALLGESRSTVAGPHRGETLEFMRSALSGVRHDCHRDAGGAEDIDGDWLADVPGCDNCVGVRDETQRDGDRDGIGDVCDNCPDAYNPGQRNSGVLAQRETAGLTSLGAAPPPWQDDRSPNPAWASSFPGDACNPDPLTTIASRNDFLPTHDDTRTMTSTVFSACFGDATVHDVEASAHANNVLRVESFVGGATTELGNTRFAVCTACDGDDATCVASRCPRPADPERDDVLAAYGWKPATLLDPATGTAVTGPGDFDVGGGSLPTRHAAAGPVTLTGFPSAAPASPRPDLRELEWAYWQDAPALLPDTLEYGPKVLGTPLLWSWTRNYNHAVRPSPLDAVTNEPRRVRRQSIHRFRLEESFEEGVPDECPEMKAGVLVEKGHRIPSLTDGCRGCPMFGTFRKPWTSEYRGLEYADVVNGVRPFADVADPALVDVLTSDAFGIATATDEGMLGGPSDRAVVFKRDGNEVVGMVFVDAANRLALRLTDTDWVDRPPPTPLVDAPSHAAAMSAVRGEVAFFDARISKAEDKLSIRRVRLADGVTQTAALIPTGDQVFGEVVDAAYRAQDDAYFVLTRGAEKFGLWRVTRDNAITLVWAFSDGIAEGSGHLASDADGLLTVTRREAQSWRAATLAVDVETLVVQPVAHAYGEGELVVGVASVPGGMLVERSDRLDAEVLSFGQYAAQDDTWQGLLQ